MRAIPVAAGKAHSLALTALDPPHPEPDDLFVGCLEIGICCIGFTGIGFTGIELAGRNDPAH